MPSEVYKLIVDNSQLQKGLKEAEGQAAAATGAITASLQKVGDSGATGAKGIHLVTDATKLSRKEMQEAKGAFALIGEEIGIRIPRHARSFITSIEGVAPALNAAFNAVAVIAIGMAIFEAGKKVVEFFEKSKEAAEKNAKAWTDLQIDLDSANDSLQVANDRLEIANAKLEHKPINGLKLAIDEAIESADALGKKLDDNIGKIAETLKNQSLGFWGGTMLGDAQTGDISKHATELQRQLDEIDIEARKHLKELRKNGATQEEIDAATRKINDDRKTKIDKMKTDFIAPELSSAQTIQAQRDAGKLIGGSFDRTERIAQLTHFQAAAESMSDFVDLTQQHSDDAQKNAVLTAAKDKADAAKSAIDKATKAQMDGFKQELDALKQTHLVSLQEEMKFWNDKLAIASEGNKKVITATLANEMQQQFRSDATDRFNFIKGELEKQGKSIADAAPPSVETYFDTLQKQDQEAQKNAQAAARETLKIAEAEIEAAVKLEEARIKLAEQRGELSKEGAASQLRDLHANANQQWTQALGVAQTNGANIPLQDIIKRHSGEAVQQLTEAPQTRTEQASATLHRDLKSANEQFLQGMSSNIANLLTGEKTNWAQFLKQLGGSLIEKGLNMAMSFLPHFADGGFTGTGPVLVGERGPEILNMSRGGYVTPNKKIGGSSGTVLYNINVASGVSRAEFAQVLQQSLTAVHGQATEDAAYVQKETRARLPRGAF